MRWEKKPVLFWFDCFVFSVPGFVFKNLFFYDASL